MSSQLFIVMFVISHNRHTYLMEALVSPSEGSATPESNAIVYNMNCNLTLRPITQKPQVISVVRDDTLLHMNGRKLKF